WIHAETAERAQRPAAQQLKGLFRHNLTSDYDRRRSERGEDLKPCIPVESCHADTPTIQTLADEAVGGKVEDDFKTKSDPVDQPRLIVKLPELSKKSPEPPQKPKDKGKPIEEPLRKEVYQEYNLRSISTHMFLDHPPFNGRDLLWQRIKREGTTRNSSYKMRGHLEELQIPEDQFFENYHEACRNRRADEGYSCETSELVNRIIVLLNSIDEKTTAMLYINFRVGDEGEFPSTEDLPGSKNTKRADEDDQETDSSSSTEHSDNRRGSDIDEDYDSKSEEKPATFFYETMKDNVTLDEFDRRIGLTLENRPPSVLPSSMSSTPTTPSSVDIASPSAEDVPTPDNTSPNSEELQTDSKMQICVLVPKMQVPTEDSTHSSSKPLKLSSDEVTDAETLPSTDTEMFPSTKSTYIETFPSIESKDTETFPSTKSTYIETFPSTESIDAEPLLSTETTHTEPKTLSKFLESVNFRKWIS
ncbi:uncharacterized protein TNIN_361711, partial [Trichonephila inaurata madagascariensis]